jgi:hypothetical protein
MKISGGCHCGFITYEGEADPERVTICHCTDCQTLSGTAFRIVVPVPDTSFKMLTGQPTIYIKIGESGNKREQSFCPRCGSPIYATAPGAGPKVYNVRAGTIRQRDQLVPKSEIWARSKQPWVTNMASLRSIEKQ